MTTPLAPRDSSRVPVIVPDVGASGVRLSVWFAEPGHRVFAGDRLVEIAARGATFDIPAPVTGRLIERLAFPPDSIHPQQIVGYVEAESD